MRSLRTCFSETVEDIGSRHLVEWMSVTICVRGHVRSDKRETKEKASRTKEQSRESGETGRGDAQIHETPRTIAFGGGHSCSVLDDLDLQRGQQYSEWYDS
jgi:hypothetical protein